MEEDNAISEIIDIQIDKSLPVDLAPPYSPNDEPNTETEAISNSEDSLDGMQTKRFSHYTATQKRLYDFFEEPQTILVWQPNELRLTNFRQNCLKSCRLPSPC